MSREPRTEPFAGCLGLSAYFPDDKPPPNDDAQILIPVLQCHGEDDDVISIGRGQFTADVLRTLVKEHTFLKFPTLRHECNEEELKRVKGFICEKLK